MKTSRFTDSQIIAVLKQAEGGTPVPELCREHGISSATFYKWRSKFGGMDASLTSQLKELQEENRRLKKMYAESQMTAKVLREAMAKKPAIWRARIRNASLASTDWLELEAELDTALARLQTPTLQIASFWPDTPSSPQSQWRELN